HVHSLAYLILSRGQAVAESERRRPARFRPCLRDSVLQLAKGLDAILDHDVDPVVRKPASGKVNSVHEHAVVQDRIREIYLVHRIDERCWIDAGAAQRVLFAGRSVWKSAAEPHLIETTSKPASFEPTSRKSTPSNLAREKSPF